MRKSRKQLLCGMLVCAMAATTVFSTSPMTKAETVEIVSDATQNNAAILTIHAKGSGLTVYAWDEKGGITKAWPGDPMTDEGNGWCSISFDQQIKGLLICKGNDKLTPEDVTDKTSGEWWFDTDSKVWSDKDPNGGSETTPTPSGDTKPTPTPVVTPSAKPEQNGKITINSITPKDKSELEAGKEQTIKVDAESTINDGKLYYKFEVSCDGEFVGEHHYDKESTYTFTPEAGKEYTAIIYVQAHDEENTFEKVQYTYTASGNAENPGTPSTTAPVKSDDPGKETEAPDDGKSTPTPKPSKTPTASATPTGTPGTGTPNPSSSPSGGNSGTTTTNPPSGTSLPQNTKIPLDNVSTMDVKFSVSKASSMTLGKSVELQAIASNGTGKYTYRFRAKKSTETQAKVIRDYSDSSTCIWTPSAKGTYTLYVDVKDGENANPVTKTITNYKVKGLTLSASTSKKSPQKKNTKVKITAKSSYASSSVKYKFVIKLKGKKVKSTSYQKSKTYTWKPTKKGTYTIYIYAKDSKGTTSKKLTFKIK